MSLDNYIQLKVIGKGSYGEVWLSRNKKDKKQYVLKKMDLKKASKRERKAAEQEAKLLSKLKHPNIVSYKDSFESDSAYLYISMQYCEGGDLYNRLKEQKGSLLEERQIVEWFVQISMALQYMHERNILHRDLKTQNIFLTKSKIIKVGDLGIARVLDSSSDMATTLIGTPYYMSPELFSNKPYNHKSDVWALGCCVYEMTTLKHAFNAKDMNSLVYKILRGKMPVMPKQYSVELVTLLKSMLHQDPDKRPSVSRILRDPYIKKNITIFLEGTKQRHRSGSASSARSVNSRMSSAARPDSGGSQGSRPGSSNSAAKVNLVGGGDGSSGARRSADMPVPIIELEPISEQVKPVEALGSDRNGRDREVKILNCDPGQPEVGADMVDHRGDSRYKRVTPPGREEFAVPSNARRGRPSRDNDGDKAVESVVKEPSRGSKNLVNPNKARLDVRPRPLPPPPVAERQGGLPVRREDLHERNRARKEPQHSTDSSKSSGASASSRDQEEAGLDDPDAPTPRSLPNLSARERRRKNVSSSQERPGSARRLRLVRPQSVRITKAEKKEDESQAKPAAVARGHHRQPSIADDSSSSSEEGTGGKGQEVNGREKRREDKDMKHFICLLDTTLRMNKAEDKSDEESGEGSRRKGEVVETSPEERVDGPEEPRSPEKHRRHLSMPSAETLGNTGRLMERIRLLRKDCMQGVGFERLRKAYEILERFEDDEVEPKLVDLLGKECFDDYAGKIWQLKFCEDSAFGFKPS